MKSDVASLQLKHLRKVSYAEGALILMILVVATKFCTLPSVLAGFAESKAVWAVALLTAAELSTAFFAFQTAKAGGLPALSLPRGVKVGVYLFFSLFFALKLSAFTREAATYFALSLFENAPVLPVMILTLVACGVLARKGFAAPGRMLEILMWLFVFVFLFVVIFTRTAGEVFNALAMFNPDVSGLGKGVVSGAAWFGDSAVLSFLDLRGKSEISPPEKKEQSNEKKAKRRIALAATLFSFVTVLLFYAVFTAVYGDAMKMTDYAFIKLSAFRANTDELGSADWPVIILWSVVTTIYLTLLMVAGRESLYGLAGKEKTRKRSLLPFFLLGIAAAAFAMLFLEEEGDYQQFMTEVGWVFGFSGMAVTAGLGVYTLVKKGRKNEK